VQKIEKGDLDPIATRTPELDQLVDHVLEDWRTTGVMNGLLLDGHLVRAAW
jgi:hypothetical protein